MSSPSPKYLVFVAADANHNKFYRMTPKGDTLLVEYGRVGCDKIRTDSYHISEFDKIYRSKIKKGYTDKTELIQELIVAESTDKDGKKADTFAGISDLSVKDIIMRLQKYANKVVAENYTVSSAQVTQKMCDEAQKKLEELVEIKDLDEFNKQLVELFQIIPRKMKNVRDHLATDKKQFDTIIAKEQDILDTMRGQVISAPVKQSEDTETAEPIKSSYLDSLGLSIEPVDKAEEKEIKEFLGSLSSKYCKAWKIVNNKTQTKFDKFLKDFDIRKRQLVWHGSRNENWWSIIQTGLMLRPTNAVITGKMFGYGIYGALQAQKSYGYTSGYGSYWARGGSDKAFMAVFDMAYGIPYDVYSFDSKYYNFNWNRLREAKKDATCLHAHKGSMLRNDEIIVYKEEQMTIKYLVELKA